MIDSAKHFYEFEGFRLDADNPSLWCGDELVSIPPKALEILILLVENKGEIVTREDLLETVWKDTFVEEGNINYTISLLRKTFGNKDLIQTIPRRGYRFTGEFRDPQGAGDSKSLETHAPRRWVFAILALVCVVGLTSFALWFRKISASVPIGDRTINSLAILPFKSLGPDEGDNTVALGLTGTLISRLGSLNRFAVRPFEAVSKPQKEGEDAIAFGRRSKVDAILDGTLERIGDRLRINVRLLDVRDGAQLWTGRFDEAEPDLLVLQDKLADAIASSLTKDLTARDQRLIAKRNTGNTEAYLAYVRGRTIYEQRDSRTAARAMDEFQHAVMLDPTFALTYTGLADAYSRLGGSASGGEADDAYEKSRSYAQKALSLDPDLAEAYNSLGRVNRIHDWDWKRAEQNFRRAIEINPNLADAHRHYAQMLTQLSRHDEALAEIKIALQIDPISPTFQTAQFAIIEAAGKFDDGLNIGEKLAAANRESLLVQRGLATFLFHKGEYQRVIDISSEMLARNDQQKFPWLSLMSSAYQKMGRDAEAVAALTQLEELARSDTKALYSISMNYADLGRIDDTIAALKKCLDQREERVAWINVEPRFGALRNDPRFHDIVKSVGLE